MAINQAPKAVLSVPSSATVGDPVQIDPTASQDPDGQIVNHDINFGDGVVKATPLAVVEHRYATAGTYTVTLTVRDRAGKTGKATQQIVVSDNTVQVEKRVLVAEDFAYLGAMRLPQDLTPFSYCATTARKVNGRLHFFMTGENSTNAVNNWGVIDPIFEFADTEQYSPDYLQAPRATVLTFWGDVYQGKRCRWGTAGQPEPMQYLLPGGLLWAHDRLYWSYYDGYNVAGYLDPCYGCTELGASPAEMKAYGPWRPDVGVKNAGGYLLQMPDGSLGAGLGLSSGNAGSSWGPQLNVGAVFPTPATPVGPSAPLVVFPSRYVKYDYPGGSIAPDGTLIQGRTLPSLPRSGNYVWHDPAPALVTEIDPAKSGGAGSFTQADGISGCVYIDLPDKHGLLFGLSYATGHVWYGKYNDCGHGFANPCGGGTGPNSSKREPSFVVYDPAQCAEVAAGTRDSKLVPALEFNPDTIMPPNSPMGCSRALGVVYFDAETRKLYAVSYQADLSIPGNPLPLMHVFQIR